MLKLIINILHILTIICIYCLVSWEIYIVSYYQNKNFILTSEYQKYNFTFISSVMNILNSLFLVWVYFDKHNVRIINYLIFLLIMNIIMGLWCCFIYTNYKNYGHFNDVINVELYIYVIKWIFLFGYASYILLSHVFNKNIIKEEITQNLIPEPIKENS